MASEKVKKYNENVYSSKSNKDVNLHALTPMKAKRGIPCWFTGNVSSAFSQHIFYPSPPKKLKKLNVRRQIFPACASTATWRELHRQKVAVKATKFYKKPISEESKGSSTVTIDSVGNTSKQKKYKSKKTSELHSDINHVLNCAPVLEVGIASASAITDSVNSASKQKAYKRKKNDKPFSDNDNHVLNCNVKVSTANATATIDSVANASTSKRKTCQRKKKEERQKKVEELHCDNDKHIEEDIVQHHLEKRKCKAKRSEDLDVKAVPKVQKNKKKATIAKKKKIESHEMVSCACMFCGELYLDPPSETWIMCRVCGLWAHELCASVTDPVDYTCDNCI